MHRHRQPLRSLLLVACCLALSSCISSNIADWPDTIPRQQVFVDAYLADSNNQQLQSRNEYLAWTLSFYQGNLAYQSGWLDVESAVLTAAGEQEADQLSSQLRGLGAAIGMEWAKHNRLRLIDSRMLALWGSILQTAGNFDQQMRSIEAISGDVDALLEGSLLKNDVVNSRYEEILQIDLFDDF